MLQYIAIYIAISNILIFLSGVLYCIAAMNIAIYRYIVILLQSLVWIMVNRWNVMNIDIFMHSMHAMICTQWCLRY